MANRKIHHQGHQHWIFKPHLLHILPHALTHLSFGESLFNQQIYNLPSALSFLEFNDFFNSPVDFSSTPKLTHLIFGKLFSQPIDGFLPNSLTHLHFGENFDYPLDYLPRQLTHLYLDGSYYSHTLTTLPSSLKSFATHYYIKPFLLPPNVTHLFSIIGASFKFLLPSHT